MVEHWQNWSGGIDCVASALLLPESEEEVASIVRTASAEGQTVRVVGTGHSSTPLVPTDGVIVSLDRLQGLVSVDRESARATLRAGTKLHEVGDPVREHGLAMANMGDVDVQSVAGATGTGTHGTGHTLKNVSSTIVGVRLVGGSGEVVDIDESDMRRLRAARVSLGALGILTRITLQLVPAYRLHERIWRVSADECLAQLDNHIAGNRHFEFFWYPGRDRAEMKTLNPTDAEPSDLPDREGERIGWSSHIIPSVREMKFHEMEYAIPAEAGVECFLAVRERMRTRHPDVAWPVEYRTVAADDSYLSPHHGRPTVTISVHQDARLPYREFFTDIEPILRDHEGRPHWGKVNTIPPAELGRRYPEFEAFRTVCRELDPAGVFLNPYLRALFESE